MKHLQLACAATLSTVVSLSTAAFTSDETNEVAKSILSYAAGDMEDDISETADYPVSYTNWASMIRGVHVNGWSEQDKENALFAYLSIQSTNNFNQIDPETVELLRIALCECRDLKYTNALPVVRNWAVNTNAKFRADAVALYYDWCDLDSDFIIATERILSGAGSMRKDERRDVVLGAVDAVNRNRGRRPGVCLASSCKVLYRNRFTDANGAEALDKLFVAELAGYEMSSNRLDNACRWLAQTNCNPVVAAYLSGITNQLNRVLGELSVLPE